MDYFFELLPEITVKRGLAWDLDGTLFDHKKVWKRLMAEKFPDPNGRSIEEVLEEYTFMQDVPQWRTPEAQRFFLKMVCSNALQTRLPPIDGSLEMIYKISKDILPAALYLTARPETIRKGTEKALWVKNDYPKIPNVMRPEGVSPEDGLEFKARTLEHLYPQVAGIVDDTPALLEYLSPSYEGHVFLFNHDEIPKDIRRLNFHPCPDWNEVYENVSAVFGKAA